MAILDAILKGIASRALPQPPEEDGDEGQLRLTRYRDASVVSLIHKQHALSDEGTYFVTTNSTPGTGIAYSVVTAFADTSAFLVIKNNDNASNQSYKRTNLDYIKLIIATTQNQISSLQYAIKLDNVNRLGTGAGATGTVLPLVSPNMDIGQPTSQTQIFSGTPTVIATNSARLVARGILRPTTPVVNDEYIINFGTTDTGSSAVPGTAASRIIVNAPPVELGPQQVALLHLWLPGNTSAAAFEVELGLWER